MASPIRAVWFAVIVSAVLVSQCGGAATTTPSPGQSHRTDTATSPAQPVGNGAPGATPRPGHAVVPAPDDPCAEWSDAERRQQCRTAQSWQPRPDIGVDPCTAWEESAVRANMRTTLGERYVHDLRLSADQRTLEADFADVVDLFDAETLEWQGRIFGKDQACLERDPERSSRRQREAARRHPIPGAIAMTPGARYALVNAESSAFLVDQELQTMTALELDSVRSAEYVAARGQFIALGCHGENLHIEQVPLGDVPSTLRDTGARCGLPKSAVSSDGHWAAVRDNTDIIVVDLTQDAAPVVTSLVTGRPDMEAARKLSGPLIADTAGGFVAANSLGDVRRFRVSASGLLEEVAASTPHLQTLEPIAPRSTLRMSADGSVFALSRQGGALVVDLHTPISAHHVPFRDTPADAPALARYHAVLFPALAWMPNYSFGPQVLLWDEAHARMVALPDGRRGLQVVESVAGRATAVLADAARTGLRDPTCERTIDGAARVFLPGVPVPSAEVEGIRPRPFAVSPDGTMVVGLTCTEVSFVRLLAGGKQRRQRLRDALEPHLLVVAFSPSGEHLLVAELNDHRGPDATTFKHFNLWRIRGDRLVPVRVPSPHSISWLFSDDGKRFAMATADTITVQDLERGRRVSFALPESDRRFRYPAQLLALSSNGAHVVTLDPGADETVARTVASGTVLWRTRQRIDRAWFTSDGMTVVAQGPKQLHLFGIDGREVIVELFSDPTGPQVIARASDGLFAASPALRSTLSFRIGGALTGHMLSTDDIHQRFERPTLVEDLLKGTPWLPPGVTVLEPPRAR